ncbi:hypothetical protein Hanom_Chr15g01363881 [Helianthus anomalus]
MRRNVAHFALCTLHFSRSHRRELLESRLCIFDRARVVEHKGYKDQVVGDAAHDVAVMRMRDARLCTWCVGPAVSCAAHQSEPIRRDCVARSYRLTCDMAHARMDLSQVDAPRMGAWT